MVNEGGTPVFGWALLGLSCAVMAYLFYVIIHPERF
ncbi:MAG: potassium-transporting ATPase subunit F [Firmicutes bacterium]|nr:potassium-transporting ATPase subunit F [Bacillota bacterium]